ncbi:hypothetical protein [Janthinobacterium sp. ROICE36]|nr:hypothetical protein [Janthinobacterium sp. ROICE36]
MRTPRAHLPAGFAGLSLGVVSFPAVGKLTAPAWVRPRAMKPG